MSLVVHSEGVGWLKVLQVLQVRNLMLCLFYASHEDCRLKLFLCAVLDTEAAIWLDRKGVITSPRLSRPSLDADNVEPTRRCRHGAAVVENKIYLYGGLRGGKSVTMIVMSCCLQIKCGLPLSREQLVW